MPAQNIIQKIINKLFASNSYQGDQDFEVAQLDQVNLKSDDTTFSSQINWRQKSSVKHNSKGIQERQLYLNHCSKLPANSRLHLHLLNELSQETFSYISKQINQILRQLNLMSNHFDLEMRFDPRQNKVIGLISFYQPRVSQQQLKKLMRIIVNDFSTPWEHFHKQDFMLSPSELAGNQGLVYKFRADLIVNSRNNQSNHNEAKEKKNDFFQEL